MTLPTGIQSKLTFEQRLSARISKNLAIEFGSQFAGLSSKATQTNVLLAQLLEQTKKPSETPVWANNIIANLTNLNMAINKLILTLGGKPELENPASVASQRKLVTVAGAAEQLPDVLIPFDCHITIKARVTNTDTVHIGKSKLDAEDDTKGFPLEAGEAIEYKIRNLSILWVDADVSGEGIHWTVEEEVKE